MLSPTIRSRFLGNTGSSSFSALLVVVAPVNVTLFGNKNFEDSG